ncbi:hypothetical protein ACIQU6_38805 [Streptomyces sp. NPDC090442]|uniref:hypothetical protein n=1 Tax=Streptomyces sp. NPDC090442 TaxID=3365962 RepID=UPI00383092A9
MPTNDEPQAFEEQQAELQRALSDYGFKARPPISPRQTRAALDALLDGRPQLAALALNLLSAVVESGTVVTDGRTWASQDIASTVRKGRRAQMLDERDQMITERFPVAQQPAAHVLAQLAENRAIGEKAKKSMPFMIRQAAADGMEAPDIADLLGVTTSHVYAVLRKEREEPTPASQAATKMVLDIMAEYEEETNAARRRKAAEHGVEPDPEDS